MPTKNYLLQVERAELIQAADDARDPTDPFKVSAGLRSLLDTRLADAKAKEAVTLIAEGDRATASGNVQDAIQKLKDLLHDGYNFIKALPSYEITDPERLGLFTSYGWTQGQIGQLPPDRIEALAAQAIAVTPTITDPDRQYPTALVTLLTEELTRLNANQPLATTGDRQAAVQARDAAVVLLEKANDRTRFFYCSASDDEDQSPELASIGRQPRRDPGDAQSQLAPAAPGAVMFDEMALTLSVAEMPARATSLRAYRQSEGMDPEPAGESETTTVSVVEIGPLSPEVPYEFWLVGVNSAGEGPESEHVVYATPAPV